jgi:hypothetical protein
MHCIHHRRVWRLHIFQILLVAMLSGAVAVGAVAVETNGPTIPLLAPVKGEAGRPVADFMYFVPLISPVPVASLVSPGNSQVMRVLSTKRSNSGTAFTATCELEVEGDGKQQSLFDVKSTAHRHEKQLEDGQTLPHQLKAIDVRGAGVFLVEVEGQSQNNVLTVTEVRLHFNAHGHVSPVWINLCDIVSVGGNYTSTNEKVARVNTLTFQRRAGPPMMKVGISSVKNKDAGDNFWQNFKGRLAGATVNMFIPPLRIEKIGNQTMLDFGAALISGAKTFTFPKARNLRPAVPSLAH